MSAELKPPTRTWSIPALFLSVLVPGLLGLAAGSKVDDLLHPIIGPTFATIAGLATACATLVWFGIVSYRALTR